MITTKTGDKGQTSCGNKRVDKDDLLVEVIGSIDELQSVLGLVRAQLDTVSLKEEIYKIQKDLLGISGELACGIKYSIEQRVIDLEEMTKEYEAKLTAMTEFLVPGENLVEAQIHVARTVTRRAERRIVTLNKIHKIEGEILKYFNRLSDYLFIIARQQKT
jgi:cob(I)alamin adenosyltransferase